MKTLLFLMSLIFSCQLTQPVLAQKVTKTTAVTNNNYLMTTGVPGYVPAILMTAAEIKKAEGSSLGAFQVVLYGEAVKQFADPEEGTKLIKMAEEAGAEIILCEFALKKFGIAKDQLPAGLKFVGNAFQHSLNMQKKGFYILSV